MKFSLDLNCQRCGAPSQVVAHLNDTHLQWRCEQPDCAHENRSLYDSTVGLNILCRSSNELSKIQDHSMCIVLAATAFEVELSWLHRKWKNIEAGLADTQVDDLALEEELRKYGTIADKITAVSGYLHPSGLDAFVRSDNGLKDDLERFPSLRNASLARGFQESLFWPRNRILHAGYALYGRLDAERCFSIADFGLKILRALDRARAARLELSFMTAKGTTEPGYVNPNGQVTVRNTGLPGTDHLQYVYQLACSHCGDNYGANGTDIHDRKCPKCQGGTPGLPLDARSAHA